MIQIGTSEDIKRCRKHVIKNGCYDFTHNGECSKCGSCCSSLLPLKQSEITFLRKLIKNRHLNPHTQPKVVVAIDLTCPFLTDDYECSIYNDRPFICRVFKCDTPASIDDYKLIDEPLIPTNVRELF